MQNFSYKVSTIWSVADLFRGDHKQPEHGRVIFPFLVLRRLDQVLVHTRLVVLKFLVPEALREQQFTQTSRETFYNMSKLDFGEVLAVPNDVAANLMDHVPGFSKNVQEQEDAEESTRL